MIKTAYQIGVMKALQDAGFTKHAVTLIEALLAPLIAGGAGAAGGAALGGIAGDASRGARTGMGAGLGGLAGGVTLPLLGELATKGKISPAMLNILGRVGTGAGAAGGGLAGYKHGG